MSFTARRRRHRSLGVVLGRLSQWGIGFVGLLVAFSILLPSFKAGDLIQLLGIGSVAIGFAFRAAIKHTLAANGIDLPFPTQQLLFHDQTEETDGDRARQREGWPAGKSNVPASRSLASVIGRRAEAQASRAADVPGQNKRDGR